MRYCVQATRDSRGNIVPKKKRKHMFGQAIIRGVKFNGKHISSGDGFEKYEVSRSTYYRFNHYMKIPPAGFELVRTGKLNSKNPPRFYIIVWDQKN